MKTHLHSFLILLAPLLFFTGCGEEEITVTDNVPKDYESPLEWTLPEGWTDTGEKSDMVMAKLKVEADGGELDLSISSFEGNGGSDLENLNRWLRQLGRHAVDEQGLANLRQNLFLGLHTFLYFDLTQDAPAQGDKQFLTAILRENNRSWFFKLSGARDPLRVQATNFKAFLTSIRLQGDPDDAPELATPPPPPPTPPLLPNPQIVTALSGSGGAAIPAGGPLPSGAPPPPPAPPPLPPGGLPPPPAIPPEVLAKIKERQPGFVAPTAPTSPPAPPAPAPAPAPPPEPSPASSSGPKWTAPEGWQELPATGMRKGNFTFGEGENKGEVTVIPLPAGAGSLGANIKRWAGQVGISDEDFQANPPKPEATQIGGKAGWFIPLRGKSDTILTGMADHDGMTWFFKMKGPNDLVKAQEANFKTFLGSVSF